MAGNSGEIKPKTKFSQRLALKNLFLTKNELTLVRMAEIQNVTRRATRRWGIFWNFLELSAGHSGENDHHPRPFKKQRRVFMQYKSNQLRNA